MLSCDNVVFKIAVDITDIKQMQLVVFTSIRFSSPPPLSTVKSHIKSRYGSTVSAIKSISFTLYIFLLLKHNVWLLLLRERSEFVFLQIVVVHRVKRQDFSTHRHKVNYFYTRKYFSVLRLRAWLSKSQFCQRME